MEKKGQLKNAEARLNGFFVKGEKVKGANLTQEFCDEWNGVKKSKPAPKVEAAPVVEEAPAEEEPAPVVKKTTKKKKKSFFGK